MIVIDTLKSHRGLGAVDYFMLGFGSIVGIGWTLINDWYLMGGGPIAVLSAFIIGTVFIIPIGLCYAEMSGAIPVAGGVIAYAYEAKGLKLSFIGGWFVVLAYMTLLPWEAIYLGHILSYMIPILKMGTPLYTILGYNVYPLQLLVNLLLSFVLIYMNYRGAEISGTVQTILTTIIFICAGLIIIFSLFKVNISNLLPIYESVRGYSHKNIFSGIISTLVVVPFFLAGFDTIPQSMEEAKDKEVKKKIPKIVTATIISSGLFYSVIIVACGLAMKWTDFIHLESPAVAELINHLYGGTIGKALYYTTIIGALAGLLSTWNGMFMASTHLLLGMGRARLLPGFFNIEHKKYQTPIGGVIFCGIATIIGPLLGIGIIRPLTNVGSLGFIIGWMVTSISTLVLRKTKPEMYRPFIASKGTHFIWVAIIVSVVLTLISLVPTLPSFIGEQSILILAGWSALGFVFYTVFSNYRMSISEWDRKKEIYRNIKD